MGKRREIQKELALVNKFNTGIQALDVPSNRRKHITTSRNSSESWEDNIIENSDIKITENNFSSINVDDYNGKIKQLEEMIIEKDKTIEKLKSNYRNIERKLTAFGESTIKLLKNLNNSVQEIGNEAITCSTSNAEESCIICYIFHQNRQKKIQISGKDYKLIKSIKKPIMAVETLIRIFSNHYNIDLTVKKAMPDAKVNLAEYKKFTKYECNILISWIIDNCPAVQVNINPDKEIDTSTINCNAKSLLSKVIQSINSKIPDENGNSKRAKRNLEKRNQYKRKNQHQNE
jgi:hypothetical protein